MVKMDETRDIHVNQAPDHNSPNHILNALNNDCLQECFRRLPSPEDFLNVANVCQRFRSNARACFPATIIKITSFSSELQFLRVGQKLTERRHRSSRKILGIFLYHFGDLIKAVDFDGPWNLNEYAYNEKCFAKVVQYCAKTLKGLVVHRYKSHFDIGTTFDVLESLKIYANTIVDFKPQPMPHLKVLAISDSFRNICFIETDQMAHGARIFEQFYPQLDTLILDDTISELNDTIINDFLALNSQLRTLHVSAGNSITSSIFNGIDTRLPNLEHLEFYVKDLSQSVNNDWAQIFKIPRLKSLQTNINGIVINSALADLLTKNNVTMERFFEFYKCEEKTSQPIYCTPEEQ